jgi:hypothetical protein
MYDYNLITQAAGSANVVPVDKELNPAERVVPKERHYEVILLVLKCELLMVA